MPGYLDFKAIAEAVDITSVANHLGLTIHKNRAACPACNSENDRALEFLPESNSFRCWTASPPNGQKCLTGDCIGLYAHVKGLGMYASAKALAELFGIANASRNSSATAPQKPESRTEKSQPAPAPKQTFDPAKFAARLVYTDEVKALDISEEDAERMGVGYHAARKAVYFPIRNPDGSIAGFIGCDANRQLKLPPQWLAGNPKVVQLKRA